jgi:cellulose synthase/poly-beta-1,6-N-acetylglucosamine synthase-like glycosyltransferase
MSVVEFSSLVHASVDQPSVDNTQTKQMPSDWPAFDWPDEPVRVNPPSRAHVFQLRGLILAATVCLIALLCWLLSPDRLGDPLVYLGLTLAVVLRGICRLFEWYNYWSIKVPPFAKPRPDWSVDVLTTACPGEPAGMIVRTLRAMTEIRYPHTSYLCDEGNDPYLKEVCEQLGVIHVTRRKKINAKAGNINNALRQASGEIAVVLDPDHEPSPYLLDRTLGYFQDPKVGFVQSVQGYRNQNDSFVARGAAEQSYHFYGPHMMGMNGRGTTQAIGANCVFRRSALDSIGGHAAGLAEDMHTCMRLYSKGWTSVYIPEILTRGLVPSTLGAFYKQQIKWSCGVFDLLFQEYPILCRGFSLSQKIHFLLCPLFFLRGLIGLLEMLVPMLCLVFGFIAWRATLPQIALWFLPVLGLSALIHLRVQRWLLEPRERGMHFAGGLLATATWWIYLAGFFCAVFRIKVPYIPTPKEGAHTNAIGITIPNFLVAGVLIAAAAAGIYLDSSPTALLMAGIAMINAFALIYVSITAQQLTLARLERALRSARPLLKPFSSAAAQMRGIYNALLARVREGYVLPAVWVLGIAGACMGLLPQQPVSDFDRGNIAVIDRDTGGFYTGIDLSDTPAEQVISRCESVRKNLDFNFRIVSFNQAWGNTAAFPSEMMQHLRRSGAVPFMKWLPNEDAVDSLTGQPVSTKPILKAIRDGEYDNYLNQFAEQVRQFGEPVFISFAPQQDNPAMPWSTTLDGSNSRIDFAEAWKHIAIIFREQGAANVAWVWTPFSTDAIESAAPLQLEYINWIGIPASSESSPLSFAQQYQPFRSKIANWHLPVMIDTLTATSDDAGSHWLASALSDVGTKFPEIKAVVLKDDSTASHGSLRSKPLADGVARADEINAVKWFDLHPPHSNPACVSGAPGHFSLLVDGKPFYVKGVVYNAGHDWRDADLPLTHRQLTQDFAAIHAMGGNTIRRYGTNFSDRNIFNTAADNQLKVMYGFWLPQDANYLTDDVALQRCQDQIELTVKNYRNHPGLLGWCLGNEVWGLLKHKFAQPYLTQVRHGEVLFVEKLARRIRQLDPAHPIFCAQESFDVSGAVSDYAAGAPTLDVMCVNSYYEQEIAHLDQAVTHVDPNRPYLVSEFGPDGYWDDKYNHRNAQHGLLEATAMYKAWLYADRWREYIQRNSGRDVGGVAYCWSDRFEGTTTWFGMNDLQGQPKPACAALASAWTDPNPGKFGSFEYQGPKIGNIDYPTEAIQPETPFAVHAEIFTCNGDRPTYRWTVTGPHFEPAAGDVQLIDNGESASVTIHGKPGWYRLQLKVTDREGLDEANVPIKVAPPEVASAKVK